LSSAVRWHQGIEKYLLVLLYLICMKKFSLKDDQWIRKNFEKLVEKHPGKYIAVAAGKFVLGKTRQEAEEKITQKVRNILPSVLQIPHKESLICAL